jgi:hypothetical protein
MGTTEQSNRVEFEAVQNESGSNAFVMRASKWVSLTAAIGIVSAELARLKGTMLYSRKKLDFRLHAGYFNFSSFTMCKRSNEAVLIRAASAIL